LEALSAARPIFTSFICGNGVIAFSKALGSGTNLHRAHHIRIDELAGGLFGVMQHARFIGASARALFTSESMFP
jgi:hypothetical protein